MSSDELSPSSTPVMRQYEALKAQAGDALLLFRMGDFYELFGEDAIFVSQALDLTLTSRDKNKPNPIPMAGFPHHQLEAYVPRLLKMGRKVAIGEQREDEGKKIRREIVRILTPGVHFDAESPDAQYLGILLPEVPSGRSVTLSDKWVLACLECSTGELLVQASVSWEVAHQLLRRFSLRHLLYWDGTRVPEFSKSSGVLLESLPKNRLTQSQAEDFLRIQYGVATLQRLFPEETTLLPSALLIAYVLKTQQRERWTHLQWPRPFLKPETLLLGGQTPEHLNLKELFDWLHRGVSQTRSAMGTRQLRRWLWNPLAEVGAIEARQAVLKVLQQVSPRLGQVLARVADLERLSSRVVAGLVTPRDTWAIGHSLAALEEILEHLTAFQKTFPNDLPLALRELIAGLSEVQSTLDPLAKRILTTQKEDPPMHTKEGGIFRWGTSERLDHLLSLTEGGQKWLLALEAREREATQIPSLKVRYHRVFGYYIEITQTHLKSKAVPPHYQRKQTMVGAERFFTEELKKFEEEILTAAVQQNRCEAELFEWLAQAVQQQIPMLMKGAQLIGELDAWLCLAGLLKQPGWIFPTIDASLDLDIRQGKHPLLLQALGGHFVPNDLIFSHPERRIGILTGPNMGGKSTFMRQTALLILLGQIGAPLPALQARWGLFTSIHTRIGAQDAILQGQSTFMVEMNELAAILHEAGERSLILLDEVGRGTSTYDGMSVAWASLAWIGTRLGSRTLFATHYHELIQLSSGLPGLFHAHVAVAQDEKKESGEMSLRFLYQVQPGPTQESFGIQVAKLAGLPNEVIQEAWATLRRLESHHPGLSPLIPLFEEKQASSPLLPQVPVARARVSEDLSWIRHQLEALEPLQMTPLQALQWVAELKKEATQRFSSQ